MNKQNIIQMLQSPLIKNYLEKKGIKHISLVGSFSRNEQTEKSDVDLVYDKKEPNTFSYFDKLDVQLYLRKKLKRKVDMISPKYIFKPIKNHLLATKIKIF